MEENESEGYWKRWKEWEKRNRALMALLLLIPGIGDKLCLEASGELFQDVFHIGIEIHGFFFSDSEKKNP